MPVSIPLRKFRKDEDGCPEMPGYCVSIPLRKFRKSSDAWGAVRMVEVSIPLRKFRKGEVQKDGKAWDGSFHPSKEV